MSPGIAIATTGIPVAQRLCLAVLLIGCKADLYEGVPRNRELDVPSFATFQRVSDAMQLHCATLDCHGQIGRNLRLYGHYGMRLDPKDNPLEAPTTVAEYEGSYWSLVGLEPEIMANVVADRASPDALAMVRKPRGIEQHKGGKLMAPGDSLDRCVVGWVTNQFDAAPCEEVIMTQRPELDGGP
jgi:hypothetical protein